MLIAPTGAGKTLAGFLPSLVELSAAPALARTGNGPSALLSTGRDVRREGGLHTLYISPLKALAVDIARNLERPVAEMDLAIRIETRTGDTPASKRQRQRRDPPHILLTTPEQLALILATPDAPYLFGSLRRIVLDELPPLMRRDAETDRGECLVLENLQRQFRGAVHPQEHLQITAFVGDRDTHMMRPSCVALPAAPAIVALAASAVMLILVKLGMSFLSSWLKWLRGKRDTACSPNPMRNQCGGWTGSVLKSAGAFTATRA